MSHQYNNGKPINIGDRVVYAGVIGRVVFIIEDDRYSPGFVRDDWAYRRLGLGIKLRNGQLFVLDGPDDDLKPSSRGTHGSD